MRAMPQQTPAVLDWRSACGVQWKKQVKQH
jgi:hypothetical protein